MSVDHKRRLIVKSVRPNNESTIWAENVFSAKFIIHWDTFLKNKRETGTDSTLDNTLFALFSSLKSLTDNSNLSAFRELTNFNQFNLRTKCQQRLLQILDELMYISALCKFWEYLVFSCIENRPYRHLLNHILFIIGHLSMLLFYVQFDISFFCSLYLEYLDCMQYLFSAAVKGLQIKVAQCQHKDI